MATRPVVRVEGARELRSALRRGGEDLGRMRDAHRAAAEVAARAGQGDAPRRTGLLAASVRAGSTLTAGIVRAGSASVPYAGVIEYGWAARHIAPQPFLLPGAERTEPVWLELYRSAITRIVEEIERKAHP